MKEKTRLTKAEVNQLVSIQTKLSLLQEKYEKLGLVCRIESNGTVADNLDCAIASLEVILQEY